jgi:hypothetical protein
MSKGMAIVPASMVYFKFKLLQHIIYVVARITIPAIKHLVNKAGGVIGPVLRIEVPIFVIVIFTPWLPTVSNQPWSQDFIRLCPKVNGAAIWNCEDNGTRNHILQEALFDRGVCIRFLVNLLVSSHPSEPPIITIYSGSSFS